MSDSLSSVSIKLRLATASLWLTTINLHDTSKERVMSLIHAYNREGKNTTYLFTTSSSLFPKSPSLLFKSFTSWPCLWSRDSISLYHRKKAQGNDELTWSHYHKFPTTKSYLYIFKSWFKRAPLSEDDFLLLLHLSNKTFSCGYTFLDLTKLLL